MNDTDSQSELGADYQALKERYKTVVLSCEICGSEDHQNFQSYGRVAEPGVYGPLNITICSTCGYKMQNPRHEDAFYVEYYEAMYREVAFGALAPSDAYINQQKERGAGVLSFVRDHGVKPGVMLDHGCASGATMIAWRDAGWQVQGVDPHRPSVESGRAMGLEIEVGVGEALPFSDGQFDLVLSLGSTEHAYNLRDTMSELWRVLKPDGHLMIRWRSEKIFGSPLEYYNHNHYRFFSPNTWKLCLARYGFSIMATTEEKLEGWDSYSYILAKRDKVMDESAVASLLDNNVKDCVEDELARIQHLRDSYYERCQKFLAFVEARPGDSAKALVEELRCSNTGISWGFLGGDPEVVISRSQLEAQRYISEYESGRVK